MKPNRPPLSDEKLSQAFESWVVNEPLPPRFEEQVWRRIARAEPTAGARAGVFAAWLQSLTRPRVAMSYVTVLLAFGLAAGLWTAQVKSSQTQVALGTRYVHSIDPFRAAFAGADQ